MLKRTWHGWSGLLVLAGATAFSLAGAGWARAWFYQLAWWGYILALDGAIQLKAGNSLLRDRQDTFWLMAFVSATFWFGWELVNLRLDNWHYLGVVPDLLPRWLGAFAAFATVLPGVLLTYELLGVLGIKWGAGVRPFPKNTIWQPWFIAIGVIMFALPLIWPRIFFPLVWGGLIFLLEPLNFRRGAKSLVRFWQKGDLSHFVRLLLAGLICGFVWESFNFLAGARWEYAIPYLDKPKIFAMPLAGYLGFPPFAVECYVFFAAVSLLRGGRGWEADDHQRPVSAPLPAWLGWALLLAALAFDLWMLVLIDRHLVKGWAA
jgi:hypothetical protein